MTTPTTPAADAVRDAFEQWVASEIWLRQSLAVFRAATALATARESALIAERDALLIAGGDLANCAYNLAQRSGEVLSARLVAAPQGLPPHFPHEADRETGEGLEPAYSVSKLHEYAERYALEALEAQAASVEPLTRDGIDKLAEVLEVGSLGEVEPETVYAFTRAIEARFAPQPQAVVASSPAQAVDAVDELREALRGLLASGGVIADASPDELQAALSDPESEPIVKTQAAAVLRARAALQASRQPQAQQDWALDVEALATKEPK